jgi:hypothetical protein
MRNEFVIVKLHLMIGEMYENSMKENESGPFKGSQQ